MAGRSCESGCRVRNRETSSNSINKDEKVHCVSKVHTFILSVTFSSLKRFPHFFHCRKAHEIWRLIYRKKPRVLTPTARNSKNKKCSNYIEANRLAQLEFSQMSRRELACIAANALVAYPSLSVDVVQDQLHRLTASQ